MLRRLLMATTLPSVMLLGMAALATTFTNNSLAQGERKAGKSDSADNGQVDKVLDTYKSYRERVGQSEEQVRKEIDGLAKEMEELVGLRVKLSLALAEVRSQAAAKSNSGSEGATLQELKGVHTQLQNEINTARNQLEQLATQLKAAKDSIKHSEAPKNSSAAAPKSDSSSKSTSAPKASSSSDPG